MDKIKKIFKQTLLLVVSLVLVVAINFVYGLTFPSSTPVGETTGGEFMNYFNKMLVVTGSTTPGIVKKAEKIGTTASSIALEATSTNDIFITKALTVGTSIKAGASVEANVHTYSSDRRLKTNIIKLEDSLDKILKLRGVEFTFIKDEMNKKRIGLIAQEVEDVYPEIVNNNSDGFKGVDYGNLVAPLIEAIKEQQKHINTLEERILKLEKNLIN